MSRTDFSSKITKQFVDEQISGSEGFRKYEIADIAGSTYKKIIDRTTYNSVGSSYTKDLDAAILNTIRNTVNNISDGKYDFMSLDTTASSGTDKEICDALTELGWYNDCVE